MSPNYSEAVSKLSIEELIRMVTIDRATYQAPAIEAAEAELRKRNISASKIEELKNAYVREAASKKRIDADAVGLPLRLVHYLVDTVAWAGITFVLALFMSPFLANTTSNFVPLLFGLTTWFAYFVFLESAFQKTVGKLLTGTKVVMKDGRRPTPWEIFVRTFGRILPFDNVSFFFMGGGGLHDYISGTTVVKSR